MIFIIIVAAVAVGFLVYKKHTLITTNDSKPTEQSSENFVDMKVGGFIFPLPQEAKVQNYTITIGNETFQLPTKGTDFGPCSWPDLTTDKNCKTHDEKWPGIFDIVRISKDSHGIIAINPQQLHEDLISFVLIKNSPDNVFSSTDIDLWKNILSKLKTKSSGQNSAQVTSSTPIPVPNQDSKLNTAGWKTFTWRVGGCEPAYRIDIPQDWKILQDCKPGISSSVLAGKSPESGKPVQLVLSEINGYESIDAYIGYLENRLGFEGSPPSGHLPQISIHVGDDKIPAIKRYEFSEGGGFDIISAYIENGGQIYSFSLQTLGSSKNNEDKFFDTLMSTVGYADWQYLNGKQ